MPDHFERLCSAIDKIPADLDFSVPQLSQTFGLPQDLERHRVSESTEPESGKELVMVMQETLLRTPHLPAKERRKGRGKSLLQDSSAKKQVFLFLSISLINSIQRLQNILSTKPRGLTMAD